MTSVMQMRSIDISYERQKRQEIEAFSGRSPSGLGRGKQRPYQPLATLQIQRAAQVRIEPRQSAADQFQVRLQDLLS